MESSQVICITFLFVATTFTKLKVFDRLCWHLPTALLVIYCVNITIERKSVVSFMPEPVFVNLLRSPGTDSQSGGPVTLYVVLARHATST